jgi:hypothetical protein
MKAPPFRGCVALAVSTAKAIIVKTLNELPGTAIWPESPAQVLT